jgi:hypothetical protein
VIWNWRWSSASRQVLASGTWHYFLLCRDRCLGVLVGQMLRQVLGLCGKIICTKAVLLIIRVYIIWINLCNGRTCYLIYWTALVTLQIVGNWAQHQHTPKLANCLWQPPSTCLFTKTCLWYQHHCSSAGWSLVHRMNLFFDGCWWISVGSTDYNQVKLRTQKISAEVPTRVNADGLRPISRT